MRGHIVGAFQGVAITRVVLRRDALKKIRQIQTNVRIGILLNDQGSRSVLNKNGEKPGSRALRGHPRRNFPRERIQTLAACADFELMRAMCHFGSWREPGGGLLFRRTLSAAASSTSGRWRQRPAFG